MFATGSRPARCFFIFLFFLLFLLFSVSEKKVGGRLRVRRNLLETEESGFLDVENILRDPKTNKPPPSASYGDDSLIDGGKEENR